MIGWPTIKQPSLGKPLMETMIAARRGGGGEQVRAGGAGAGIRAIDGTKRLLIPRSGMIHRAVRRRGVTAERRLVAHV